MAQVFSSEFCKIAKKTFFTEHLWETASMEMGVLVIFHRMWIIVANKEHRKIYLFYQRHIDAIYMHYMFNIIEISGQRKLFF